MLTRRKFLKSGMAATGAALLVSRGRWAYADVELPSRRLEPFVDPLPLPVDHLPVAQLVPEPDPKVHQHFGFRATGEPERGPLLYEVHMRPGLHQFHRDLPMNPIWGYTQSGGAPLTPLTALVPGPTFRFTQITQRTLGKLPGQLGTLREARPVLVRFINDLVPDDRPLGLGFGDTQTTIHFHGGHTPARSDGFPLALSDLLSDKAACHELKGFFDPFPPGGTFGPGEHFDYYYPNRLASFSVPDPIRNPDGLGQADDMAAFRWYHDHPVDFTGQNAYKGLAGLALTFDEYEADDETGTRFPDTNLRLPSGLFDIPLLLQDKIFNADGQLLFDPFEHDGLLGNQFLVNGKVQPFLNVQRRKYRFRFLNGSNARVYQMFLSQRANGPTFHFTQIGNESGLVNKPIREIDNFRIAPAQRAEVVIDFADLQFRGVTEVFFENRLEQTDGRRPDELGKGTLILKFNLVGDPVRDEPSRVYGDLEEIDKALGNIGDKRRAKDAVPADELASAKRRTFEFDRRHGSWAINGQLFGSPLLDVCGKPLASIPVNTTERWRLVNESGGWAHPIHVHLEFMHVLSRNGRTPPPEEQDGNALKDTVYLGPNDEVEVAIRFRDFTGPYVFHCHNMEHEDAFMMAIINVFKP